MTSATVKSSAALCEPVIRFTLDAEGRPITELVTQHDLDEALQELFRTHMYGYRRQFDGMRLEHKVTIQSEDPCSPVLLEGAYLVIETTFSPS